MAAESSRASRPNSAFRALAENTFLHGTFRGLFAAMTHDPRLSTTLAIFARKGEKISPGLWSKWSKQK